MPTFTTDITYPTISDQDVQDQVNNAISRISNESAVMILDDNGLVTTLLLEYREGLFADGVGAFVAKSPKKCFILAFVLFGAGSWNTSTVIGLTLKENMYIYGFGRSFPSTRDFIQLSDFRSEESLITLACSPPFVLPSL